jgi:hypothetical protein
MGKWVANEVLDRALLVLSEATHMMVLDAQPVNYAAATTSALAQVGVSAADFAVSAGDVSGRKVSIAGKNDIAIGNSGIARHVALVDTVGSRLLYVTTCPDQALTAGGQLSLDPWSVEIGAPL